MKSWVLPPWWIEVIEMPPLGSSFTRDHQKWELGLICYFPAHFLPWWHPTMWKGPSLTPTRRQWWADSDGSVELSQTDMTILGHPIIITAIRKLCGEILTSFGKFPPTVLIWCPWLTPLRLSKQSWWYLRSQSRPQSGPGRQFLLGSLAFCGRSSCPLRYWGHLQSVFRMDICWLWASIFSFLHFFVNTSLCLGARQTDDWGDVCSSCGLCCLHRH